MEPKDAAYEQETCIRASTFSRAGPEFTRVITAFKQFFTALSKASAQRSEAQRLNKPIWAGSLVAMREAVP